MKYPNGDRVQDKFKFDAVDQKDVVEIPDTSHVYINNALDYRLAPNIQGHNGIKLRAKGLIRGLDA